MFARRRAKKGVGTSGQEANMDGLDWLVSDGELAMPGDVLATLPNTSGHVVRVGPGVSRQGQDLVAQQAGRIEIIPDRNKIWLDCRPARYMPALEDLVVGIVQDRFGEGFRVDIGAHEPAQLGFTEFQGATKRNRPNLKVGDVVYARVTLTHRFMETEISCILPGSRKSWLSGESELGPLTSKENSSMLIKLSPSYARYLLAQASALANENRGAAARTNESVLSVLDEKLNFELAVGVNGRIWIDASDPQVTILVGLTLQNAEKLRVEQQVELARRALATL